jgi:hypothetical protein
VRGGRRAWPVDYPQLNSLLGTSLSVLAREVVARVQAGKRAGLEDSLGKIVRWAKPL